jgi:transmembrane sensor
MNNQIYDEATEWLVKHREGDLSPQEKGQFDSWLRASPQHMRAYLEMSAIWEDLPAVVADGQPTPQELIDGAKSDGNVHRLDTDHRDNRAADAHRALPGAAMGGAKRGPRARLFSLAAALLIAIIGGAYWYELERNTYTTGIGEQRSIVLADGSTIELNSRSRVRIHYTKAQRDVNLIEGQALFRVAHDLARPFVVHSGVTKVLAVGTQFDVYRKRAATVVTVIEGKVEVLAGASLDAAPSPPAVTAQSPVADASGSRKGRGIYLTAGEQLSIPTGSPSQAAEASANRSPQPANVATVMAWTQHFLIFESSPLTDVAEEFNRYNRRPLVITDREIASMHISGIFSSADPALFLKFLRAQPELTVAETDTEIRIGKRHR